MGGDSNPTKPHTARTSLSLLINNPTLNNINGKLLKTRWRRCPNSYVRHTLSIFCHLCCSCSSRVASAIFHCSLREMTTASCSRLSINVEMSYHSPRIAILRRCTSSATSLTGAYATMQPPIGMLSRSLSIVIFAILPVVFTRHPFQVCDVHPLTVTIAIAVHR